MSLGTNVDSARLRPRAGRAVRAAHVDAANFGTLDAPGQAGATKRDAQARVDGASWALSCLLFVSTSVMLALFDQRLQHWFIVPVTVSGVLIGVDAVEWLRRRVDVFDPAALLGLFGVHFFYLAPILHVMLDYWVPYPIDASDWRDALGRMALLNAVGLIIYRFILTIRSRRKTTARSNVQLNMRRFYRLGILAAAVGVLAFCYELSLFGGISGYLSVTTEVANRTEFAGLGWLVIIAESFPIITFVLIVVKWRKALAKSRLAPLLLLAGLALTQFIIGGLRGSRSNTVWPIIMGLILIHLLITKISRKHLLVVVLMIGAFMYLYGFYKGAGLGAVDVVRGTRTVEEMSSETGRDIPGLLLGDLGRSDIQALVLDRQLEGETTLRYGITYIGDVSFLVPRPLLPVRPEDKVMAGTELLFGPGSYSPDMKASKVYGMAGEAIMNFGAIGGVASFALLGIVIRLFQTYYDRARRHAALLPKLLAPMLCINTLLPGSDFDNRVFFILKFIVPLALVIWLAIDRQRTPGKHAQH